MTKYDPWGPISATLFATNDSDLVQQVIDFTGVVLRWPQLDGQTGFSHSTRIRAYRPIVQSAYLALPEEARGQVAQIVVKQLIKASVTDQRKRQLIEGLNDIGWTVSEDGLLTTQDAILSEQFFPPGTPFDAYVAIRSILETASHNLLIVDAYMGSTIFVTLRSLATSALAVRLLTMPLAMKTDFRLEAGKFREQLPDVQLEVRTSSDFHDRFIVVDNDEYYHVGASINHAGKRAFLISRLEDRPITNLLKTHIEAAWNGAADAILKGQ